MAPIIYRNLSVTLFAALCAWTEAAELVTLSPENFAEYAPRGKEADAFFGDYVLRNDRIVAAVADPALLMGRSASRWAISNVAGAVIDLTPRTRQNEQLTAFYPAKARFKPDAPNYQHELPDESETWRKPGREPQSGTEVVLALPPYELASGKMLQELEQLPPHLRGSPKPWVAVSYRLADGWDWLQVECVYHNPTAAAVRLPVNAVLRAAGEFAAGEGFNGQLSVRYDRWWRQAFGVLSDDRRPAVDIPPGGEQRVRRRLLVAADSLQLQTIVARLLKETALTTSITVTAPDGPVADAEVTIEGVGGGWTDAQGRLSADLPPGKWPLSVEALGRGRSRSTLTAGLQQRVELPSLTRLAIGIRDQTGQPLPAKIVLQPLAPAADGGQLWPFPVTGEERVGNVCYTSDGSAVPSLAPGRYRLAISHGPEYTTANPVVTVAPGVTTELEVTLERVMDTTGWISADLHNHSTVSGASEIFYVYPYSKDPTADGDSTASQRGRVLALLASHIEFAVPTEHNFISSYEPILQALGATDKMATCPGIGLTAGRRHTTNHQNVFPVIWKPGRQDGGALQRPEHVGQLQWLLDWDNGSEKLVQIVQPRGDPLQVQHGMDVLDLIDLEPLVERQPLPKRDNRALEWLQLLQRGYRLFGVINSGTFDNFSGTGMVRNWVQCSTDDPAAIDPDEVRQQIEQGRVVMSTGPLLSVTVSAGSRSAGPGATIATAAGPVNLTIKCQAAAAGTIDRIQILGNSEPLPGLDLHRPADDRFADDVLQFEGTVPLNLSEDTYLIVIASGGGEIAVSNPIYVDVGGDGFRPWSPLADQVSCRLEFAEAPLARSEAPPGTVLLHLKNDGPAPAADDVTLEIVPPEAGLVVDAASKPYDLAFENAEATLRWQIRLREDYLRDNFPVITNYNLNGRFGVRVRRSDVYPGRKASQTWMRVDHSVTSLPPLADLAAIPAVLADAVVYPVRTHRDPQLLLALRLGVSEQNLVVHARAFDTAPTRQPVVWEGSCLELFGAMAGRHPKNTEVPGHWYPVSQIYLAPAVGDDPAQAWRRAAGEIIPLPTLAVASRNLQDGWELSALVPLALLGIDIDEIVRSEHVGTGFVPVSMLGKTAKAGRFVFEARATVGVAGGMQQGTIFRSNAPHVDHSSFGRMRLDSPVTSRLVIVEPLSADPAGDPGTVRLDLTNPGKRPLRDTVQLVLEPPDMAAVDGETAFAFELAPGVTVSHEWRIRLTRPTVRSGVYVIVPRSPLGVVARTGSPQLPIGDRAIPVLPPIPEVDQVGDKLAAAPAYRIRIGEVEAAEVRLAKAGNALAVDVHVRDRQVMQHERPWKGSDFEIFASLPGSEQISQVFLLAAGADQPTRALKAFQAGQVPAPEVQVRSALTDGGYHLQALVPLTLLGLSSAPPQFLLELQVSSVLTDGGKRQYGTLFGSVRAYQHSDEYGRFRFDP